MIQLIGMTVIDWGNYVRLIEKHTGKYPTKELDRLKVPSGTPEAFVLSLKGLREGTAPKHLYYTFICVLDQTSFFTLLLMDNNLDITLNESQDSKDEEKFFLLSGEINRLANLLTTFSTRSIKRNLRVFLNQMFLIFEGLGFKEMFSNYRRTPLDDNTFVLERKP